jgi:L-seryl-tRNA(Ser) seleniumtransferase
MVSLEEMVELGGKRGIPVFDDIGSGCLLDAARYGLAQEPMPQQSIDAGAALVCFSGDKLLGGPQAGIIIGKKTLVDKMRNYPLTRALRVDKVRLAGLAATYALPEGDAIERPVW